MWLELIDKKNNHKTNIFVFSFFLKKKKKHFPIHGLYLDRAAFLWEKDKTEAVGRGALAGP